MSDDKPKSPFENSSNPLEALAAASALGVTVATQAMGFWLSVLSGVTAAAREAHEKTPEAPRKPEAKAEAAKPRPTADVVPIKPKPVEDKPVAAKPAAEAPAPKPVTPKPEPVKAEPVAAPAKPVEAARPKAEPVVEKVAAKAETPAVSEPVPAPKAAPKPAAEPRKAAPKPAAKKAAPKPAPAAADAAPVAAPAAKLTPDLFVRPKAQERPAQPDDLKLIKGIGPKLEVTLNGLGIWTNAQVAALEPAEVAWLDDYLGLSGRIVRDGWIEAAKAGGTNG